MLLTTPVFTSLTIWAFVTILFFLSVAIKRNDIADIAWGPGIALASWSAWWSAGQPIEHLPTLLILGLITIWALRIGVRILLKNIGKPEDPRYQRWRESWGIWFYPRSYLQVFLLQGTLMVIMSSVFIAALTSTSSGYSLLLLTTGALVWITGFVFETVGDYQLDRFISQPDNQGKLMRYGLWKYSRHPNYFGEITMWWGLALIAGSASAGIMALLSPLVITYLICYVSGIPLLESFMERYEEWDSYKKHTSVLIPLPPRS